MKKRVLFVVSVLLMVVLISAVFVGCKSEAEKEAEYYAEVEQSLNETTATLENLMNIMLGKNWTSSFAYAKTTYSKEITRGSTSVEGWPDDNEQVVNFMIFDINYTDSQNYTIKTSVYNQVTRADYVKVTDIVKYRDKFTVAETLEYTLTNGVASGELKDGFNPIEYMIANAVKEELLANGISASDNFRIYTHFMRINTRMVYDGEGNLVTKAMNDSAESKYWTGYDADIAYDWEKVYSMDNNRLTVLYSKGKQRINSFEIYNEKILAYYAEKDKVNKELVLKADVVEFEEMVVDFEY